MAYERGCLEEGLAEATYVEAYDGYESSGRHDQYMFDETDVAV